MTKKPINYTQEEIRNHRELLASHVQQAVDKIGRAKNYEKLSTSFFNNLFPLYRDRTTALSNKYSQRLRMFWGEIEKMTEFKFSDIDWLHLETNRQLPILLFGMVASAYPGTYPGSTPEIRRFYSLGQRIAEEDFSANSLEEITILNDSVKTKPITTNSDSCTPNYSKLNIENIVSGINSSPLSDEVKQEAIKIVRTRVKIIESALQIGKCTASERHYELDITGLVMELITPLLHSHNVPLPNGRDASRHIYVALGGRQNPNYEVQRPTNDNSLSQHNPPVK